MYKHILFATDLSVETDFLIKKVKDMQKLTGAKLSIIYVEEPMYAYNNTYSYMQDIENQLVNEAREKLSNLGEQLFISPENQIVKLGSAKSILLETAKEIGIDLIICGSHGKHGLSLLLGSTANSILNGATCDVLTVRFPQAAITGPAKEPPKVLNLS